MNKAKKIASWVAGCMLFVLLAAFERVSENKTRIQLVEIDIIQSNNQHFINNEDIQEILDKQDDSLLFKSINAINTALLEESLENHPFVAEAEVFSTLDGLLSVQVEQKTAIARIVTPTKHYYLDAKGNPFPTTKSFSARVPVITGATDSTSVFMANALLQTIDNTTYFTNWLAEIHVTSTSQIELIPVKGKHRVIFGTAEDASEKLMKLEGFYKNVVTEENLNQWKTLNVAYNKLLVSTKY